MYAMVELSKDVNDKSHTSHLFVTNLVLFDRVFPGSDQCRIVPNLRLRKLPVLVLGLLPHRL